jgi:DNA-binding NarL/FixJ family response regulator
MLVTFTSVETGKKENRPWLKKFSLERRKTMVSAVRQGESLRRVARRLRVSVSTVHYWVERAEGHITVRHHLACAPLAMTLRES